MVNKKDTGIISADFNCIIDKSDSLKNQSQKMSPSLKRMVNVFGMTDSFRSLHPHDSVFSRYYSSEEYGEGATRTDRTYHFGDVEVKKAQYM